MFYQSNINAYSYQFSSWKQYIVSRFVSLKSNLRTEKHIQKAIDKHGEVNLLVWSVRQQYSLPQIQGLNVISVEDGFVRSVGLGAEHTMPISLVFDDLGIYFDSTSENRLEHILNELESTETIEQTARKIINLIRLYQINKYNLNENEWQVKVNRKIIVVPGQVENDKSIQYGSPVVKDNLTLLKEVRRRNPDSYIVFKVHPDIYRNCRVNHTSKKQYYEYADEVVENFSTFSLIKHADEIHTMTSLFGFEALLQHKKVVCYGQPFYAGWGLTEDIYPVERRKNHLTLEQLVYGAYFVYPMYVSLITGQRINAMEAIAEIARIKQNQDLVRIKIPAKEKVADFFKKTILSVKEHLENGSIKRV
ncbi:hypothetical protein QI155_10490 [Thermodesulfovibrio sp. 1176]|uniref:capsular polysaccharide export protein, LipB/KpsS family n=1 Tax=Thermodesulfovibrio sp. 1176 TaxID=3043424 RepID=UPI0024822D6A|nr:hypothetical protein [Thermodesulfovibrio sp. 1176]MDI1472959.1 hypothetical protein [Thermodesulfovibrio sp. 1176]